MLDVDFEGFLEVFIAVADGDLCDSQRSIELE
jgi:hypothetical protein